MNIEMLKITISVLIGTCLGLYFNIALLFLFLIFIIYILFFKKQYKIYLIILGLVFILIRLGEFKYNKVSVFFKSIEKQDVSIIAEVISNKEEKEYVNKYIIKIKKLDFKYDNLKLILYTEKNINLNYGQIVKITGILENANSSRNYKGFDYQRYLRQNKIYGICNSKNVNIINDNINNVFTCIFDIKNSYIKLIEENFEKKEASFLKGLLLGDMTSILDEDKESFQKSNLAHVLAISGMHVAYIITSVDFILDKIIISKKLKNCLEIVFLIFFCIFTGNSVSCMRAVIMMILVLVSKNIYRLNDFYSSLFFSFCFLVIYNPYNIEAVGMWLSFLGTLALVVFRKKIEMPNKIINYILNNLYTCITVQLLIFPVIAYCYNSISLTFFISNFLVSFFIGPVLILGYICIFLYKFKLLIFIENILIIIIMKIAEWVSVFKLSNILVGTPKFILVIIYYIIIICFINRKWLSPKLIKKIKEWKFKLVDKNNLKNSAIFKKLLIVFFLSVIVIFFIFNLFKEENLEIHFLDVGQGDCTFIILPNGKNILIDGGDKTDNFDYGKSVVAPYLLDKNITKIDYMIVSHFDSDHVGGLLYIAECFNVENILIGVQFEFNDNLNEMIKIIKEKRISLIVLEKGNKIKLDRDIYLDILFPFKECKIEENAINNNSLVFKLIFKDLVILFTGDIEEEAEEKLVELYKEYLKCDILKVAHHGSKTSSTEDFIKYANPRIALIGCGIDNKFGHPNSEVLNRLNNINCKIYRTDINGEISTYTENMNKIKVYFSTN